MKFLHQIGIILFITFLGELLKFLIPLPIPASIYGLLLMLLALMTRVVKLEQVKEVSSFFIDIMPLLFVPAGVGLLVSWNSLKSMLIPVSVITLLTTVLVMAATGKTTEFVITRERRKKH